MLGYAKVDQGWEESRASFVYYLYVFMSYYCLGRVSRASMMRRRQSLAHLDAGSLWKVWLPVLPFPLPQKQTKGP